MLLYIIIKKNHKHKQNLIIRVEFRMKVILSRGLFQPIRSLYNPIHPLQLRILTKEVHFVTFQKIQVNSNWIYFGRTVNSQEYI